MNPGILAWYVAVVMTSAPLSRNLITHTHRFKTLKLESLFTNTLHGHTCNEHLLWPEDQCAKAWRSTEGLPAYVTHTHMNFSPDSQNNINKTCYN